MKRLFVQLTLFLFSCSLPLYGDWRWTDKAGDDLSFEWIESGQLQGEENVFVRAFLEAYSNFSEKDLAVPNKNAFLIAAFEDVREEVNRKESALLSVKHNGECIGVCEFKKTEVPREVYIAQLALDPEYWGRGIGKQMVFGICKLYTDTHKLVAIGRRINTIGRGFFNHIGFTESNYIYPGYDPAKYVGYELELYP